MIIDELDDIKCEECYRLAIEDIAQFATDPENLARLDPKALEMRQYLGNSSAALTIPRRACRSPGREGKRARRDLPAEL